MMSFLVIKNARCFTLFYPSYTIAAFHVIFLGVLNSIKKQIRYAIEVAIAFTPWLISMYVFYWLDYEIWTSETAHRGKMSVTILTIGMGLSFLIHSHFIARKKK